MPQLHRRKVGANTGIKVEWIKGRPFLTKCGVLGPENFLCEFFHGESTFWRASFEMPLESESIVC